MEEVVSLGYQTATPFTYIVEERLYAKETGSWLIASPDCRLKSK